MCRRARHPGKSLLQVPQKYFCAWCAAEKSDQQHRTAYADAGNSQRFGAQARGAILALFGRLVAHTLQLAALHEMTP